jgi:hypothetical protein
MRLASLTAALRRRRSAGSAPTPDARIERIEARLEQLEAVVEGLQDSVYREAQRQDDRMEELRARTEPAEIAKALSEDARKRGL